MGNKNLIFYVVFSVLALLSTKASAVVATLNEEDEAMFYDDGKSAEIVAKPPVFEVIDEIVDENGVVVKERTMKVPSRGVPLYGVAVPDEINARAVEYLEDEEEDDPSVILLHADTPRSTMYPIGSERERMEKGRYEEYDPFLRKKMFKSPEQLAREAQIKAYREAVNECVDSRKDQLDMEIGLLDYEDLYKTTAYLSETMNEIEQCYDGLGMDIIDDLYDGDNEVLRDYNRHAANYRVKSSDVTFAPKYCKENCSVSAVAALQMEKFGEYKNYLLELLDKAPKIPQKDLPQVEDEVVVNDDVVIYDNKPAEAVLAGDNRGYVTTPKNGVRPDAIRIRDENGKERIVRWHPTGNQNTTATPNRVIRAQRAAENIEEDVPYIDESEF